MRRFKANTTLQPVTPTRRQCIRYGLTRSGFKPKNVLRQSTSTSLVKNFDNLISMQNTLGESLDAHFIPHVKSAAGWRKKCKLIEEKIVTSKALLAEKDRELSIKAVELNEAKVLVDNENRARKNAEQERDELKVHLDSIKRLILTQSNVQMNDTSEKAGNFLIAETYSQTPRKNSNELIMNGSRLPMRETRYSKAINIKHQHYFQQTCFKFSEVDAIISSCQACRGRIKFGKPFLKCGLCGLICHKEIKCCGSIPCSMTNDFNPLMTSSPALI